MTQKIPDTGKNTPGLLPVLATGTISALAFLILSQGGVAGLTLGYFAPLPLLVAGLGFGIDIALWSGILGSFCIFLAVGILSGDMGTGLTVALSFVLVFAFPILILVRTALRKRKGNDASSLSPTLLLHDLEQKNLEQNDREQNDLEQKTSQNTSQTSLVFSPIEHIVTMLSLYACAGFTVLWLGALGGGQGGLLGEMQATIPEILEKMPPVMDQNTRDLIMAILPFSPSFLAISWFTTLIINAIFAQSLLQSKGRNLRPTPILKQFRPPQGFLILVTGLIAVLSSGEIAFLTVNLSMILAIPYFLTGLAVSHWAAQYWKTGLTPLCILYITLLFIPLMAVIVVFIGVIDRAIDIRGLNPHQPPIRRIG